VALRATSGEYATVRVLTSVRSTWESGHLRWSCDSRVPYHVYFVRVAPEEGVRKIQSALGEREHNGCYRSLLFSVAQLYPARELEPIAIATLNDPDPETASNAAMMLGVYGSLEAERHLWARLKEWTEEWRGRDAELYHDPERRASSQARLGASLHGAIETGQGWYLDEGRRQRMYALCWNTNCRERYSRRPDPPAVRVRVHRLMYDQPAFEVGHYHPGSLERFDAKVAQFPRGTKFGWCTDREGSGGNLTGNELRELKRQARAAVESHGHGFIDKPARGSCITDR
jgi:hypothetical protein